MPVEDIYHQGSYETIFLSIRDILDDMKKETGVNDEKFIKKKMHELIRIDAPPLKEYLNFNEDQNARLGTERGFRAGFRGNLINNIKNSLTAGGGLKRKRKNKNKKSINKNMKINMKRSRKTKKSKIQKK